MRLLTKQTSNLIVGDSKPQLVLINISKLLCEIVIWNVSRFALEEKDWQTHNISNWLLNIFMDRNILLCPLISVGFFRIDPENTIVLNGNSHYLQKEVITPPQRSGHMIILNPLRMEAAPLPGPALELQSRATRWLSSFSHKHLLPVSVRLLNISLWTWCCIAAMWPKRELACKLQCFMGSESSPRRADEHSGGRVFRGRGPLAGGHHPPPDPLWCVLREMITVRAARVSSLLHQCECATLMLSQTCCSELIGQHSEDGLHFCFHQID